VGPITVTRKGYRCPSCGMTETPWDAWAGLGSHRLTPGAEQLAALAGASWSFDVASTRLEQMCGLAISDQTVRRVSEAHGQKAARYLAEAPEAIRDLDRAEGLAEFTTDGTCVPTVDGWQEMRLSLFSKRQPGSPIDAASDWSGRDLPKPHACLAMATIAPSEQVGESWARRAAILGWQRDAQVSVIADGARWIWKETAKHWPCSEPVLDIYHLSEHVHAAASVLKADASQARQWARQRLQQIVEKGARHSLKLLQRQHDQQTDPAKQAALASLLTYMQHRQHEMPYRARLKRGQTIGSGQVEGGCKSIIGRRFKAFGGKWLPQNAVAIANLRCLHHSNLWHDYWNHHAAA